MLNEPNQCSDSIRSGGGLPNSVTGHVPGPAPSSVPATPDPRSAFPIEREADDAISLGAICPLVVPREELDKDFDDGQELDLASGQALKIRKPNRREWIRLFPEMELPTKLLLHKPSPDSIEVEHFFVDRSLRAPILEELRHVRVLPYFSLNQRLYALLIVNVTPENSWYESMQRMLKQPPEFFRANQIRIYSDKPQSRYRVKHRPLSADVPQPGQSTSDLLGKALGSEHFITTADHPLYRELVDGKELD